MPCMRSRLAVVLVAVAASCGLAAQAQDGQQRTFLEMKESPYFVLAPRKAPSAGRPARLLVVVPGGDGSAGFWPWVRDSLAAQVPPECAVAMVTAAKWRDDQQIVWPTAQHPVDGMKYPTEKVVRAVVRQVAREFAVEPGDVAVLAWSSGGAAVHPLLAAADGPFARGYVAMSIFPDGLDVAAAKGRRYVLDQSPEDQTTIFQHVRTAHAALTTAGAQVLVSTYRGGHGWQDAPLPRLKKNLAWLFGDQPAPAPRWPPPKASRQGGKLVNQLHNGGFEQGLGGWNTIGNSGRCTFEPDAKDKAEGRQALRIHKQGGPPLDLLVQHTELADGRRVVASVRLQSKGVQNAWVKVRLFDAAGKELHEDSNLVQVPADGGWKQYEREWSQQGAVRAAVQVLMVGAGQLWVDDVVLHVES